MRRSKRPRRGAGRGVKLLFKESGERDMFSEEVSDQ